MRKLFFLLFIAGIIHVSCNQNTDIDQIKQELINTDLKFSDLSVEKGKNHAFSEYIHPNGVMMRNQGMPIRGKKTFDSLQQLKPDTGYTLKWKPVFADAAKSGDLGYTYGIWLLSTKDTSMLGTYTTIWKKDDNGKWKFILDTGNQGLGKDEENERKLF